MTPVRVLIVDDHPMFRTGLSAMLSSRPGWELVAEAATGEEAVEAVERHRPDAVVMDLHLPGLSGVDATRAILASHPEVRVLVLTMHEDDASLVAALRAGARGYLLKDAGPAEIVRAVEAVAAGDAIFGDSIAQRVIEAFAVPPRPRARDATFPQLTAREVEVLDLMAQGRSNASIAGELVLNLKTVRNHVSAILTKLAVPDRSAAIVMAREAGLGRAETAEDGT